MAIGGGVAILDQFLVAQVEHPEDTVGTQIEVLMDQFDDAVLADIGGAEGVDGHGGRHGHADGIGDLDLQLVRQAGRDQVLGHIAPGVGSGPVHLGRVLAGEGTAAVTGHAAVGIDDDLAPRQTTVTHGPADHEFAGRVDVVLGLGLEPAGIGQHRLDDLLHHRLVERGFAHIRTVLGR